MNSISKKHAKDIIAKEIQSLVEDWRVRARKTPDGRWLLYYLPPNKSRRIGRLRLCDTVPGRGWLLTCGLPVTAQWSEEWVHWFARDQFVKHPVMRGPIRG